MSDELDMTNGVYRRIYSCATTGKRINSVSVGTEFFFWRLHCVCDDFGTFEADPHLIKCNAFPRRDEVKPKTISEWLAELDKAKLVEVYEVAGETYGKILDFERLQPAPRNGRRIRRFPAKNDDLGNPGESGGIRGNPGDFGGTWGHNNNSHTHTHTHTHVISPVVAAQPTEPPAVFPVFACDGKERRWTLPDPLVLELKQAYPQLDILAECRKAHVWISTNSRKTAKEMPRFLAGWMSRSQNNGVAKSAKFPTTARASPGVPNAEATSRLNEEHRRLRAELAAKKQQDQSVGTAA